MFFPPILALSLDRPPRFGLGFDLDIRSGIFQRFAGRTLYLPIGCGIAEWPVSTLDIESRSLPSKTKSSKIVAQRRSSTRDKAVSYSSETIFHTR